MYVYVLLDNITKPVCAYIIYIMYTCVRAIDIFATLTYM